MLARIKALVEESIAVKQTILLDEALLHQVAQVSEKAINCLKQGGRLLFCGNGGSASDAQHLAAEFSGRFYYDRPPLDAEALHVNTSYLTAVGNDYGYEEIYARLIRAKGRAGDVLFAISTSGNSPNIVRAISAAKEVNMIVVGMTGTTGGEMFDLCDHLLAVPSQDTPRIQEAHITLGHAICELVEAKIFPKH